MPFYQILDPKIDCIISDFYNNNIDCCSRYQLLTRAASILSKRTLEIINSNEISSVDDSSLSHLENNQYFPYKNSVILPIMRAGLPLFDSFYTQLHSDYVIFLSTKRLPDNTTKVFSTNNIFPAGNKLYFLLDSVIGTGNTICSAISFLIDKGALEDEIVVASILSSYDGVSNILNLYNDVSIFSCYLNNQLFIDASQVPKNNDIGEKIFGI